MSSVEKRLKEIRNLNIITGSAQIVIRTSDPDGIKLYFEEVVKDVPVPNPSDAPESAQESRSGEGGASVEADSPRAEVAAEGQDEQEVKTDVPASSMTVDGRAYEEEKESRKILEESYKDTQKNLNSVIEVLQAHRCDMHSSSSRPCMTCFKSSLILRSMSMIPEGGCEEMQRRKHGYETPPAIRQWARPK